MSPSSKPPAIEIEGLRKSFQSNDVLRGIDLTVSRGSVFALLGANGAGKTTTINVLTTLLTPDAGRARVAGFDVVAQPDQVRASIGVTGQFAAVDGLLTGEENLRLMARLAHLDRRNTRARVTELIELFDLADAVTRPASTYSGGMRRRLDLAMSLILSPAVVFLDEPTTGIDPRGRAAMWEVVRNLARKGITVFLTTQYLEEADQLADHVAVIDQGVIAACGDTAELKRSIGDGHLLLDVPTQRALSTAARVFPQASFDIEALRLSIPGATDADSIREALLQLEQAGVPISNIQIVTPDLDDVFFTLTGTNQEQSK